MAAERRGIMASGGLRLRVQTLAQFSSLSAGMASKHPPQLEHTLLEQEQQLGYLTTP